MKNIKDILNKSGIDKDTSFVIGVSGGLDSMVLLHYLYNSNYKPIIVHFNHHTRKSNLQDEDLIVNYAKKNNLKCIVKDINIKEGNFHNEARKMRYKLLKEIAKDNDTKFILTGHHLDDLAETILIKITRGSNLYGYAGMHPIYTEDNFTFVRPLLYTERNSIKTYCAEKHVLFFEDESNYEDTYLRNRYRHTIVPILKQENNQFLERIYNYHIQLSEASSFIRQYSLKFIKDDIVNLNALLNESKFIQESVIAILLEQYNITFTFDTLRILVELINSKNANASFSLDQDMLFIKAYDEVLLIKDEALTPISATLEFGENKLANMELLTLLEASTNNDNELVKICYNKLTFPLKVRRRVDGDLLSFDYGRKKLKDLYIDLKVPQYKRDSFLVLTDSDNVILWVEDHYINKTLGNDKELFVKLSKI